MDFEKQIGKIERISVRITALGLLLLGLLGVLAFALYHLISFITHLLKG